MNNRTTIRTLTTTYMLSAPSHPGEIQQRNLKHSTDNYTYCIMNQLMIHKERKKLRKKNRQT